MSIRQGLLALLAKEPMYGARLRSEFEARTGGTWPLNVGQVYTTLARLERDGLVEADGGADEQGRIAYRLTPAGGLEVDRWWGTPVDRQNTPRDELVIKLALAVTVRVYVVAAEVSTVRAAGAPEAAEPPCGAELSTVKLVPLTAVTLPKAPNPPKPPNPPNPPPPAPGPRVRLGLGVPGGGVASPVPPKGRSPGVRAPPNAEQVPFTAGVISTEAAVIGPVSAVGAAVGAAPPAPAGSLASRAWTHTPTTMSESRAATVLVNVVLAE